MILRDERLAKCDPNGRRLFQPGDIERYDGLRLCHDRRRPIDSHMHFRQMRPLSLPEIINLLTLMKGKAGAAARPRTPRQTNFFNIINIKNDRFL